MTTVAGGTAMAAATIVTKTDPAQNTQVGGLQWRPFPAGRAA